MPIARLPRVQLSRHESSPGGPGGRAATLLGCFRRPQIGKASQNALPRCSGLQPSWTNRAKCARSFVIAILVCERRSAGPSLGSTSMR